MPPAAASGLGTTFVVPNPFWGAWRVRTSHNAGFSTLFHAVQILAPLRRTPATGQGQGRVRMCFVVQSVVPECPTRRRRSSACHSDLNSGLFGLTRSVFLSGTNANSCSLRLGSLSPPIQTRG